MKTDDIAINCRDFNFDKDTLIVYLGRIRTNKDFFVYFVSYLSLS